MRDVDERELRLADAELQLRIGGEPEAAQEAFAALAREAHDAGDNTSADPRRDRPRSGRRAAEPARRGRRAPPERGRCRRLAHRPPRRLRDAGPLVLADRLARARDRAARELPRRARPQRPGERRRFIRFAGYLSAALTDQGDLTRAEKVLREALGKQRERSDAYTRVRLYWAAARLAEVDGHPVRALDYARRAVALLEATEDTHHLARAHLLCAWIMGLEGKSEDAVPHLDKAEALLGSAPDPTDLAQLRVEQAKVAAHAGDGDTAVTRAREAIGTLGDTYEAEQGSAWWALAEGLALQGDVTEGRLRVPSRRRRLDGGARFREAAQWCRRWASSARRGSRRRSARRAGTGDGLAVRSQPTLHSPVER